MYAIFEKNSSFNVTEFGGSDVLYRVTSGTPDVVATLPGVDTGVGRVVAFKVDELGDGSISVVADTGDTIEGSTDSLVATDQWGTVVLVNGGDEWKILYLDGFMAVGLP
jgi:hypothetical protein